MDVNWKIIFNANITRVLQFWTPFDLKSFDSQVLQNLVIFIEAYTYLTRYCPAIYSVLTLLLNLMKQNSWITGF